MGIEAMEVDEAPTNLERKQAIYRSMDERFEIKNEKYRGQQYSEIYFLRLHTIRNILNTLVKKWKPHLPICTVLGLEKGKECILIGTLYKHMKLKPCILDEYSKERSAVPIVNPHNFMHSDDQLILEDESGRVKLSGTVISPSFFVTGTVVALHGNETNAGDFLVQDILEAGLPPQIELPLESSLMDTLIGISGEDKYVVFVSGLSVGSGASNPLQFQLLVDHITGHLGDDKEQVAASKIVRVVIAGNSVEISHGLLNGQTLAAKDQSRLSEPVKELDIMLTQLAAAVPLDIMPGPSDPANFALPQQPLHRCLFPGASVYNTFMSCTNPHLFEIDNVRFLGTSGQNIHDLDKYSEAKDGLEYMERTLGWRHVAPTAPNTLGRIQLKFHYCYFSIHLYVTVVTPFLIETLSSLKVAPTFTLLGIKISMIPVCQKDQRVSL
ncbi:hypothetical protein AQUCO_00300752v1 [Aquilegia coerulea]|uniref:DNA polymerase delta subunit OB-fold domain-containing protein n=1 Tax=Aquilegia coerulea TaxID=218851 RepID=A0A2G5F0C1_AQUCA|nr:hypothetical protein AQUCO_00300752v1 [Aquilegia coerulea]